MSVDEAIKIVLEEAECLQDLEYEETTELYEALKILVGEAYRLKKLEDKTNEQLERA